MKVTINEREYELKELTKEQAKEYIGKEVFVWDLKTTSKRKLLEVFEPDCLNPFCILESGGKSTYNYPHCASVPEEWYVNYYKSEDKYKVDKECFGTTVDHGSEEYCKQKAKELNEQKESAKHPLTNYELAQLLKCFGVECSMIGKCSVQNFFTYEQSRENKIALNTFIRYKCGEWMPVTRETVFKWWEKESGNSDISRFVSFMGWFEDKEDGRNN